MTESTEYTRHQFDLLARSLVKEYQSETAPPAKGRRYDGWSLAVGTGFVTLRAWYYCNGDRHCISMAV